MYLSNLGTLEFTRKKTPPSLSSMTEGFCSHYFFRALACKGTKRILFLKYIYLFVSIVHTSFLVKVHLNVA